MADEGLVSISNQFSGLDMAALIGGPLSAACDAQMMLARSTLDFIENVGLEAPDDKGVRKVRTANFSFSRAGEGDGANQYRTETVEMNVPLLAVVNVPSLAIDKVDITFDMEVKSSTSSESKKDKQGELDASAGLKIGPCVTLVTGYRALNFNVHASQQKIPEGLSRMLDIISSAVAPTDVKDEKQAA